MNSVQTVVHVSVVGKFEVDGGGKCPCYPLVCSCFLPVGTGLARKEWASTPSTVGRRAARSLTAPVATASASAQSLRKSLRGPTRAHPSRSSWLAGASTAHTRERGILLSCAPSRSLCDLRRAAAAVDAFLLKIAIEERLGWPVHVRSRLLFTLPAPLFRLSVPLTCIAAKIRRAADFGWPDRRH